MKSDYFNNYHVINYYENPNFKFFGQTCYLILDSDKIEIYEYNPDTNNQKGKKIFEKNRRYWHSTKFKEKENLIYFNFLDGEKIAFNSSNQNNKELYNHILGMLKNPHFKSKIKKKSKSTLKSIDYEITNLKNETYWKKLYDLMIPKEEAEMFKHINKLEKYLKEKYTNNTFKIIEGRKSFQKGIVSTLNRKILVSNQYLKKSKILIDDIKDEFKDFSDYIRLYIIDFLLEDKDKKQHLMAASEIIKLNISNDIIRYGFRDIYDAAKKSHLFNLSDKKEELLDDFKGESNEKYPYETIGDQIIHLSRIYYLMDDYIKSKASTNLALSLYEIAITKITKTLSLLKDPNNYEPSPFIKNENPKNYRTLLEGNIHLFIIQGKIIELLSKIKSNYTLFKKLHSKIDYFYNNIINPPNKIEPKIGFLDEIEWALIKWKYFKYYLGYFWNEKPTKVLRICLR